MEKYVNNLILDNVDSLVDKIKNSEEYKDYEYLYNKLSNNKKATNLIKEIKVKQKQLVRKKVNGNDISSLDKEINDLLIALESIPLYVDFINKQEELNKKFIYIKENLDNYFTDLFK